MAVVNRTLDASEQKKSFGFKQGALATGVTVAVFQVPYPSIIQAMQVGAVGLSNSFTVAVNVERFIAGTGFTTIPLVAAQAPPEFGTSGVIPAGLSLPASGSTLNNLLPNDLLMISTAGTNAAVAMLSGNVVIKPIQDIKVFYAGLT